MRTLSFSLSTGRNLWSQLQLHAKQVYGQMPLNLQSRQQSCGGRVLNFVVVIVVVGVGVAVVAVSETTKRSLAGQQQKAFRSSRNGSFARSVGQRCGSGGCSVET